MWGSREGQPLEDKLTAGAAEETPDGTSQEE